MKIKLIALLFIMMRSLNQVNMMAGGSNEQSPGLTSPLKQNGNGKVYPMNRNFVFGLDFTF